VKRIAAWLAVWVVIAGIGVPAFAYIGISPLYTHVSTTRLELSFEGTTAKCSSTIQGLSGTTGVTAAFTLQRKETNGTYTTLKTWNESASGTTLRFSGTHTITTGFTYRLSVTVKVTRNGTTETVSEWLENKP
jgi:hypothetical protein